ncbi:MAG TPA: HDIG domain-containing protein [Thermotogaceae bacterium]|nr:HDIG domain-containing protein [Thermotogaceae bacterium]
MKGKIKMFNEMRKSLENLLRLFSNKWYIFISQAFVLFFMKYSLYFLNIERSIVEYLMLVSLVFITCELGISKVRFFKLHRSYVFTFYSILTVGMILNSLSYSYFGYPGISIFLPVSLITILMGTTAGISSTYYFSLSSAIILNYSLKYSLFFLFVGSLTVFLTRRINKRIDIARAAIFVSLLQAVLFAINENFFIPISTYTNIVRGFLNPILSSIITIGILPYIEYGSRIYSSIGMLELGNLSHPLLKQLSIKAPGTYYHSVILANLAEAAAEKIEVNPILARVGSYFHDIGKMKKPEFFIENQQLENPHSSLHPSLSHIVLNFHVKAGSELARKYRLPLLIEDIIKQHHGVRIQKFFYHKAKEVNPEVKEEDFRYPGPKPQFKEAGIIMLADSIEAAIRSIKDPTPSKIEEMVTEIVNDIYNERELDESGLTLKDLELIIEEFVRVLVSTYHQRIEYPREETKNNLVTLKESIEDESEHNK